jgi:hypothetical protein
VDRDDRSQEAHERKPCLGERLFGHAGRELECLIPPAQRIERIDLAQELPLALAQAHPPRERKPLAEALCSLLVAVAARVEVSCVVVGADRRRRQVVFQRDLAREPHERAGLDHAPTVAQEHRLRVEGVGQHVRQVQRLCERERLLTPFGRHVRIAGEEPEPADLVGQLGDVSVGLLA